MRKTILITISILFSAILFAQEDNLQIINSGGEQFENSDLSISFTFGETVVDSYQNDDYILTQGYHQTESTITRLDFSESRDLELKVFPNPTIRFVNINDDVSGLTCTVYDMSGRLVHNEEISGSNLVLDLSFFLCRDLFT